MKYVTAILILFLINASVNAQTADTLRVAWRNLQHLPYSRSLKININGLRVAVEQQISKRTSIQLELGHLRRHQIIINPQYRIYTPLFKKSLAFIGLGYLYKHDEYSFSDSFKVTGSQVHDYKKMYISKYVHAFTLNSGYFWRNRIFKHEFLFELNFALGIRYKKSNRYGLNENEEMVWGDAYISRPQREQDTGGRFIQYGEVNLIVRVIFPLKK